MWIVKELEICDFDIYTDSVNGFNDKSKAEEYFATRVKDQHTYAEENEMNIEEESSNYFEAWEDGSAAQNAIYIALEELNVLD